MTDLEELQRRVEQYFQCDQQLEPAGRLILDLMRALRETNDVNKQLSEHSRLAENKLLRQLDELCAKNERLTAEVGLLQMSLREANNSETRLRTENNQLKNEMMSRWIEKMTGDRYEFHGELGDKVPEVTNDEASLLILRGALHAATAEVGKLRTENERLTELVAKLRAEIELVSK